MRTTLAIEYRSAREQEPHADVRSLLLWAIALVNEDLYWSFRANNNTPGEG